MLAIYDGPKSTDNVSFARELRKWIRKINSYYANFQGSNLTCQDSFFPDSLPKIVFDRRLYLKKEKVRAGIYAQNNTWKTIYHVSVGKDEDPDCYSSDDQVHGVNPV